MKTIRQGQVVLLASTALVLAWSGPALAQAADDNGGLQEIVVTAQKREQSMQDVPIAVTALTQDNLQANRITTVNDLSAIAPGLTVKPTAGGVSSPVFTMRGQVSYGVVAGSDKQVSVYVDGVYIGSPRGSIFDLPDIQRIEVLRGPQGTLFGRNATAGAVSVTTRDPTGEPHVKVEGTVGNQDEYRFRMTADLPQMGTFSALFSYVRHYRRGDIRNAGAGVVWDRSASPSGFGVSVSPRWLGTANTDSYFAAVKFEPSDSFKMVYKFDRNEDRGTPEGTALIAYDPNAFFVVGPFLNALFTSQNVYLDPSAKRPDVVTNSFATPRDMSVEGHSLTSSWQASDSIAVKDIFAYRKSHVFAPSPIDGVSGVTFTQAALQPFSALAGVPAQFLQGLVGQRALIIASQAASFSKQWSNELQVNYSSEKLQATVGALWFHSQDETGGPLGMQNTYSLAVTPASGMLPLGNEGNYSNKATSLAAYVQLEYKITPALEIVGGARITRDKKSTTFAYNVLNPATGVISPRPLIVPPDYVKTKPNFLIGVNWRPMPDLLIYGKYSTSFVSGGSTAGITYEPETASSFEVGFKGDFLDHRLRANLALFHVDYKHFQSPQGTTSASAAPYIIGVLSPLYGLQTASELVNSLSTYVADQGSVRAQGFELEVTVAPTRGLTIGASAGYTDTKFPFITPLLLAANNNDLVVTQRPKWTSSFYVSYETQPLFDDTRLAFRVDGQYRSRIVQNPNQTTGTALIPGYQVLQSTAGYMLLNGRVALRDLKLGPLDAELAAWAKNITNRRDTNFALPTPLTLSANFVPARAYGLDLTVEF